MSGEPGNPNLRRLDGGTGPRGRRRDETAAGRRGPTGRRAGPVRDAIAQGRARLDRAGRRRDHWEDAA